MRRIKVILGVVAAVAAMMVLAAPAMAQEVEGSEVGDVDFASGECVFVDELGFLVLDGSDNCINNGDNTEVVFGDGGTDFSIEGGSGSIQSVNQVGSTSDDIDFSNGGSSGGGNIQGVNQNNSRSGDIKLGG